MTVASRSKRGSLTAVLATVIFLVSVVAVGTMIVGATRLRVVASSKETSASIAERHLLQLLNLSAWSDSWLDASTNPHQTAADSNDPELVLVWIVTDLPASVPATAVISKQILVQVRRRDAILATITGYKYDDFNTIDSAP